jgi:hypothetical protein
MDSSTRAHAQQQRQEGRGRIERGKPCRHDGGRGVERAAAARGVRRGQRQRQQYQHHPEEETRRRRWLLILSDDALPALPSAGHVDAPNRRSQGGVVRE